MAQRDVHRTAADLPIRYKLLAIAMATASVSVLVLCIAFFFESYVAARPAVSFTIGAAIFAILAGFAVTALLQRIVVQPFECLTARVGELETARLEAEAASKAKSDFLANMSHELRNALNAIIGFSDLMKAQTLGPIGNPTYVDYATDINFSGTHLLEIISDILDVVRYESGKMELKEEAIEIESAIAEAQRLVAPQAQQGDVELIWAPPAAPLPLLYCDRVRLRQILLNILSNAIKFTKPGGTVEIRVECDNAGLNLVIKDSGIGIRPEDIARIMTPFGQIASAHARNQQGAGLGLTLTKALLDRHGGRLSLDSAPGVGTTVRLSFPPTRVLPHPP